jgi:hypothetical protein
MYTYIYTCVYHHLEVDRIWDFQADIIFLSGSFEISIFYLLQDDYVYMYIYIHRVNPIINLPLGFMPTICDCCGIGLLLGLPLIFVQLYTIQINVYIYE